MRRQTLSTACVISLALATLSFGAWVPLTGDPVPISSLPPAGWAVGDKLFVNFDLFGIGGGGAISPTADTVFVQGGQDNVSGDYGLRFLLSWQAGAGQSISATLTFAVGALPDGQPIKDVSLHIIGAFTTGTGVVNAGETVWDAPFPGGSLIGSLSTSKQSGDGDAFLSDYIEFDPINEIYVRKSFSVTGGTNGTGFLAEMFQFYSQVPEPTTVALLGLGALALLRRRRA